MSALFAGGKPVLITGGRGFLGSQLAAAIALHAPSGAEVICVDNGVRDCFSALHGEPPPGIRCLRGDIRRPEQWLPALGEVSVVIHCAALAGVSTYYRDPGEVLQVNGLGTATLLDALRSSAPSLFLNLSTSEVYGQDAEGVSEEDATPVGSVLDPRWSYACSKLYAEHLALAAGHGEHPAFPSVSVRPFNVYGPGQLGEGAVRNFAERALRGEPLQVTGDGSPTRAWLYVDDFVDALLRLIDAPAAWGRPYNVGHPGARASTSELAAGILVAAGSDSELIFVPHPGQDVRHRWPLIGAITAATGWRPQTDLEDGLARTVRWWRGQIS